MNFWRRGVGLEYMLYIAWSLELRALPYALNRPPRAAALFKPDAVNPAMTPLFQICSQWRGVTDPGRWLEQEDNRYEQHLA